MTRRLTRSFTGWRTSERRAPGRWCDWRRRFPKHASLRSSNRRWPRGPDRTAHAGRRSRSGLVPDRRSGRRATRFEKGESAHLGRAAQARSSTTVPATSSSLARSTRAGSRIDDGPERSVLRADGGFQAVRLAGSGSNRVSLHYRPPGLGLGAGISAGAILAIVATLAVALWRRRRVNRPGTPGRCPGLTCGCPCGAG